MPNQICESRPFRNKVVNMSFEKNSSPSLSLSCARALSLSCDRSFSFSLSTPPPVTLSLFLSRFLSLFLFLSVPPPLSFTLSLSFSLCPSFSPSFSLSLSLSFSLSFSFSLSLSLSLSLYWHIRVFVYHIPLTEEIRIKMFESRDLTIFLSDLLSDGDSIYSRVNLHENLGTPVKTYLICTGIPVKTCGKFWKAQSSVVRSPSSVVCTYFHTHKNIVNLYIYENHCLS